MNFKPIKTLALGLAASLGLSFGYSGAASAAEIVVGGKNFTEQVILSEMTAQLLEANGFDVDRRAGMGSAALRTAQENGQVDVYWEYTGTSLITYNGVKDRMNADETYAKVKELDAKKGITWLNASAANNTYALAMQKKKAEELGIATLSDLAARVNDKGDLTFASNAEFYARPDGLKPLQKAYGFKFSRSNIKRMDSGLVYQALRDGQVDVGLVFATDGRIPAFGFVVLKDDKGYFPAYALAPVIRTEVLDANPKIADLLNAVAAKLNDQVMASLNASVDVDKKSVEDVSATFLKDNGFVK